MAETVVTTTSSQAPVTSADLVEHEVADENVHTELAQTEDEDYKWLTDRLDAHSSGLAQMRAEVTALTTTLQSNNDQSRTMIEAQTRLIESLSSNLTALSESALLRSSQRVLENSSHPAAQTAPQASVTVTEVAPEDGVRTQESSEGSAGRKKRSRI